MLIKPDSREDVHSEGFGKRLATKIGHIYSKATMIKVIDKICLIVTMC